MRCIGMVVLIVTFWGVGANCGAQTDAASKEQIAQLLEDADVHFQRQEFLAGYELYRRVLSLEPMHQFARKKIYEIAGIYKTLEEIALKERNEAQATLLHRQYRSIVRYLLKVLTSQLNRTLQIYSNYLAAEKQGNDVKEKMLPVLENLLTILQELKNVYEQFPREDSNAGQMVERLNEAILKYEKELTRYSSPQ